MAAVWTVHRACLRGHFGLFCVLFRSCTVGHFRGEFRVTHALWPMLSGHVCQASWLAVLQPGTVGLQPGTSGFPDLVPVAGDVEDGSCGLTMPTVLPMQMNPSSCELCLNAAWLLHCLFTKRPASLAFVAWYQSNSCSGAGQRSFVSPCIVHSASICMFAGGSHARSVVLLYCTFHLLGFFFFSVFVVSFCV